jgi:dUTP pyrophosphatase
MYYFQPVEGNPVLMPIKSTEKSAGYDLFAQQSDVILPGECVLIRTGVKTVMPDNIMGFVCSRSGLAFKQHVFVLNAPGIIDADYDQEIGVLLFNAGKYKFHVDAGMRIAQMVFLENATAAHMTTKVARTGGFGSTGVNNLCVEDTTLYDELDTPK